MLVRKPVLLDCATVCGLRRAAVVPELGGKFEERNRSHKMLMSVLGGMSESKRQHVQAGSVQGWMPTANATVPSGVPCTEENRCTVMEGTAEASVVRHRLTHLINY